MGGSYTLGKDRLYDFKRVLPEEEKAHYEKYGMLCKKVSKGDLLFRAFGTEAKVLYYS